MFFHTTRYIIDLFVQCTQILVYLLFSLWLLDAGGAEVPFELEWRAEEGDGGRAYAREYVLRLHAEPQAGPYTLRASGRETSYAGVCMEAGDTAVS